MASRSLTALTRREKNCRLFLLLPKRASRCRASKRGSCPIRDSSCQIWLTDCATGREEPLGQAVHENPASFDTAGIIFRLRIFVTDVRLCLRVFAACANFFAPATLRIRIYSRQVAKFFRILGFSLRLCVLSTSHGTCFARDIPIFLVAALPRWASCGSFFPLVAAPLLCVTKEFKRHDRRIIINDPRSE